MVGWTHDDDADVPPGAPRRRRHAPDPRRAPATRCRPRGRAAARAGRARHRQDHDPGRGDRRPDREPGCQPRPGARADVLPQGGRAAARPGHGPAGPHDGDHAELDVPFVRLRAHPRLQPCGALRGAAAAVVRTRAGRGAPGAADGRPRVRALARRPAARARHPRVRERGPGRAGQGPREGLRRRRAPQARRRPRPAGVRRCRALPRPIPQRPRQPGSGRLRRPDPPRGDRGGDPPRAASQAVPARLRRRVPGHRPRAGRASPGDRR